MHGQYTEASARMKHNITELLNLMNLITRNELMNLIARNELMNLNASLQKTNMYSTYV